MEGLTEGRIVHFMVTPEQHRAAIVVDVVDKEKGICVLFVFSTPQDRRGYTEAKYDDGKAVDTWHWIEKA